MQTLRSGCSRSPVLSGYWRHGAKFPLTGSVLISLLLTAGISARPPELEWSTYLGGSAFDYGCGIALDGAGNVVVAGYTRSSGWVSGGFDTAYNGGSADAFVAKLSRSGEHFWSTYLGGSSSDYGYGIAVDGFGNVFVTGDTVSSGWVSGGFDTTYNGGTLEDAFVAKLSANGEHLWSTYLGGSNLDHGYGIAVDGFGDVFVAGTTESSGWVSGGFNTIYNGGGDAFVAKLSGSGEHLWSTYMGGDRGDSGFSIAVNRSGSALVTGWTLSSGWVSGGFDTSWDGLQAAFVVKLSGSGEHLWSTYLGAQNYGRRIAVDNAGNVFVTGETGPSVWASGGFDTTYNGGSDAFVAKLSGNGEHLWSTYLGGTKDDWGYGIAVDNAKNVFVTGMTSSSGWVSGGFDTALAGVEATFVARLSESGEHLWSTYLGGNSYDSGNGIAADGVGNVFVTGYTSSSGWVSGGFDTAYGGAYDGFVAKIRDRISPSVVPAGAWQLYE